MPVATPLAASALVLAPLFTSHMVLQQGRQDPLWGRDAPGSSVAITVSGGEKPVTVSAKADAEGRWNAALPELPAGGPYTITVEGSSTVTLDDVLVGEVWLASGQSNMEFQVSRASNAADAIANADNPQIRHFKVAINAQGEPVETASGTWECASPDTVGDFTAVGYFFAQDLYAELGVPVGIVNSTWGGTCVEAWTSREVISKYVPEEEITDTPESREKLKQAYDEYLEVARQWRLANLPADPGNDGLAAGWAAPDFDDYGWDTMDLPRFWQSAGLAFNGTIWFRLHVDIPAEWAGKDLQLSLGAIDDYDTTFFNGVEVGSIPRGTQDSYQTRRLYKVPASLVKAGETVIAVRVFDDFGDGGFSGPAAKMTLSCPEAAAPGAIPLEGEWLYKVEHNIGKVAVEVFKGSPPPPPGSTPQNKASWLYNGMISPLVPYGIRGALWYQGEQNESNWQTYGERVRAMIRDWRSRWGEGDFPFYYVQLAAYGTAADWPELRLQQDEALKEPNTGRALAIDIGAKGDIHPTNKLEVSRRLALVALKETYGKPVAETSGPVYASAVAEGPKVRISFTHAEALATSDGSGAVLGFEIAGADGVFHPAQAVIDGANIVVTSPDVTQPAALRYAWASCPEVNLVNGAKLPCAPFRCLLGK
jgi:sialate O-acetylesterase